MDKTTLYNYFQGTCTDSQRHEIRQWVEQSPENYAEFMKQHRMFDATLLLSRQSARKSMRTRILRFAGVAAVAAARAIVYLILNISGGMQDALLQQIIVPDGQRVNLILADGTDVWLNSGSRFSYTTDFSKKNRSVTLDGEGYFKVAKDKDHPFTVHTSKADVEVLGTEFNVRSYEAEDDFTTSLIEGSVRLTTGSSTAILQPNEEAFLSAEGFVVSELKDKEEFLWRDGILSFGETSFFQLMKKFEKFYDVSIRIDNPDLENYSSMGKFRLKDGVEHALDVLASDAGFTYEFDADHKLITIK